MDSGQSNQSHRSRQPPRRIVLTGFMGSGKTTVGPLVAARLGWHFIDVDDVIEAEAGAAIADLFARHGEGRFSRSRTRHHRPAGNGRRCCARSRRRRHRTRRHAHLLLSASGTLLVHLEVELNTTLARCSGTENTRPVLADQANLAAAISAACPSTAPRTFQFAPIPVLPIRWPTLSSKLRDCRAAPADNDSRLSADRRGDAKALRSELISSNKTRIPYT